MKKVIFLTSFVFTTIVLTFNSCVKDPPIDNTSGTGTGGGGTGGGGTGGGGTGGGGTTPPTVTAPNTTFLSNQDVTANSFGYYNTQEFTVRETTTFFFRFTSQYNMQAAIVTPSQLSNFTSMAAFTGYGVFNNQLGTQSVTLAPGTYYVGVRNSSSGTNKFSWELDFAHSFPASDKVSFYDFYIRDVLTYASSTKFWRPFKIETGVRYFLDGCNVNTEFYIIPSSELSKFQSGQSFLYYKDYYVSGGAAPGLWEIRLPVGDYVLVGSGTGANSSAFVMERWRVN